MLALFLVHVSLFFFCFVYVLFVVFLSHDEKAQFSLQFYCFLSCVGLLFMLYDLVLVFSCVVCFQSK